MNNEISKIIDFIEYSEGLKTELRNTWLSNKRRESVAEHSWRMAIAAMAIAPKTNMELDMEKVFKMIAIHDIAEIEAGDTPSVDHMKDAALSSQKDLDEKAAIENIRNNIAPNNLGKEVSDLWFELEEQQTNEAKFVKIIDKFEAVIQKNQMSQDSYNEQTEEKRIDPVGYFEKLEKTCEFDPFLAEVFKEIFQRRNEVQNLRKINS